MREHQPSLITNSIINLMTKLTQLDQFIKSLSHAVEVWYLGLFGKTPDHSKEISFRFNEIKRHVTKCNTEEQLDKCNEMVDWLLWATYQDEAFASIDKLRCMIAAKRASIRRRDNLRFADEVIAKVFKTASHDQL